MSVLIRSGNWHYRFSSMGKIYSGRCEGCDTRQKAEAFEAAFRRKVAEVRANRKVKALIENYRDELYGTKAVSVAGMARRIAAWNRNDACTEKRKQQRLSVWNDFAAWLAATHPQAETVRDVTRAHAEEYAARLSASGRFLAPKKSVEGVSAGTLLKAKAILSWAFGRVKDEAGLDKNPFAGIHVVVRGRECQREIFTPDELAVIMSRAATSDSLAAPLFIMAAATGLTEGDICTLKWSEIFLNARVITRNRAKTGVPLMIPISDSLLAYLRNIPMSQDSDYVFPKQAEVYLRGKGQMSQYVVKFLEDCGIERTVTLPNGHRQSVKDLHSMRHVFCYNAGKAGIPLPVVQAIVGHMSPEMTRHYMAHATMADRLDAINKMPDLLQLPQEGGTA